MDEKDKILIIEDDKGIAKQIKWALLKDYHVLIAHDVPIARQLLKKERPKVITLDLGLPPKPDSPEVGLGLLEDTLKFNPHTKVIVITGNTEKENALKAIQMGAYDFYYKPVDVDELKVIIRRAFHIYRLEHENLELLQRKAEGDKFLEGLIGQSQKMQKVFSLVRKVALTDFPVLIQGESGTGKESIAKSIHLLSQRKNNPFVVINCGAIPETLLESELFGYEKGAFTGAHITREGKLELAQGGSVFLDEVSELTLPLQVKLLRFLQEHTIERIGGRRVIKLDVRIIAATNKNLKQAIEKGEFREDLYYRLNTLNIELPPLRDRGEDILILAKYFLYQYCKDIGKKPINFSKEAIDALCQHNWPGNIRELQNKIKRAIITAEGNYILPKDLEFDSDSISYGIPLGQFSLKKARERFEKGIIIRALRKNNYNITHTATELGISRASVYELIRKYGIKIKAF